MHAQLYLSSTQAPSRLAYAIIDVDPNPTPDFLRIAGDSFSANNLAAIVTRVRGEEYTSMWTGSVGFDFDYEVLYRGRGGCSIWENTISGKGKLELLDNDMYP